MSKFSVLLASFVTATSLWATPCQYEARKFHGGSNELYSDACHCVGLKPPSLVSLTQQYGITFRGHGMVYEETGGKKWHKCMIEFSYQDRAQKSAPDCQSRKDAFIEKVKTDRALSNYARNYSFLSCD